MSIKEAIDRTSKEVVARAWSLYDKDRAIRSSYKEKVLEAGRSLLKDSGAVGLSQELVEEFIKPHFQDVKVREALTADGSTALSIEWDFQDYVAQSGVHSSFTYQCSVVSITAYPLTEDLVVRGGEDLEILSKSQWSSDPKLLEDVVARAYQVPMKMMGPPARV